MKPYFGLPKYTKLHIQSCMIPSENLYFQSRVIHGDLLAAHNELVNLVDPSGTWMTFVKSELIALANLVDIEGPMRLLYRDHIDLAAAIKAAMPDLQFAKYLRNVFAGHINDDLIAKAYEWRPELRVLPEKRDLRGTVALNLFLLETAINSYIAADGSHGMFESETDLVYPPDMTRFCAWLSKTTIDAIAICDKVGAATHVLVQPLGEGIELFEAFKAAGLTNFTRFRKGR